MKTYKALFWVVLVLLILSLAGAWYLLSSGVGADTLPTNKATKIQIVNSAGKTIEATIPLELSIKAKNMNCEQTNTIFKKIARGGSSGTVCKSDTAIFNQKVFTNNGGNITISEQLLVQVDKDNIKKNVEDYIENKYSAPLTDQELQSLSAVISTAVDDNKNQAKIKESLSTFMKEYLTRNGQYQENANYIVGKKSTQNTQQIFDNDCVLKALSIINLAVANAQKTNDFLKLSGQKVIDSVTVKVSGDFLSSESLNVSFSNADYKENVNLVVVDNKTAAEMSKMEEFLKEYSSSNNLSNEQIAEYRNVLSEYLKFTTTKSIDEILIETNNQFINKSNQEKTQIRTNLGNWLLGPIFGSLF